MRDPKRIASALLAWYDDRERDVPWRGERDPYRIWVAEVMAQQTRMETVRPYYERFVRRFPDVEALARAELDEVLKAWEGLGYYARARRLHRAAAELVARHDGRLPETPEALRELPGVGPYTAGAVASQAFGARVPAVDGNARRVLSRLLDLEEPPSARLEAETRRLLDALPDRPGDLNQALMDLGGTVCTPTSPSCGRCPVAFACRARARGTVKERPAPRRRGSLPHRRIAVGLVWDGDGRLLVARRPPEGLLGGLWEFPGGKVEEGEDDRDAVRRELREEMGIGVEVREPAGEVEHAYSHFRITLLAFHALHREGRPRARRATAWRWVELGGLRELAFPAANLRLLERLEREGPPSWG